ncbi:polygalacturonase-like [Agrilus planipennis]|uniref:endo-polygalacturonase n=1 Tax=Agrilus planipennis TaxID=224129 RepID=A0A1W4WHW6_AGRPL|nr:polygalacturonase-like [Agrilus planipennis]
MIKFIATCSLLLMLVSMVMSSPTLSRSKRASCTISGTSISNVASVKSSCTNIVVKDLTVPAGKTLDLTSLKSGTTVTFQGTLTFAYHAWDGPLVSIGGNKVSVKRASNHVINGQGAKWWDGKGSNGGVKKPLMFQLYKLDHSTVENLYIKNSPRHTFSITNCNNLTLSGTTIDNSDGDSNGGHNTDAFDVGQSNYVYIKNSKVYNQDDCLAVNSGTNYYFTNNYCSGGHGISIGSVGGRNSNEVKNVEVADCTIVNSDNGVRIKTIAGATGVVSGITYKNIELKNVKQYGITIRGDYQNSGATGTPTTGIPIRQVTFSNIHGTVKSSAVDIYVNIANGVASSWSWKGIKITGSSKSNVCRGIPSTVSC